MDDINKLTVRKCPEIACALNSAVLGNILMHHTRIEVQKAQFQYIKVEPIKKMFNP